MFFPSSYSFRPALGSALSALLAVGLLLAAAPARADNFCVGTPAELTNALGQAAITPGANEIRVRTGSYAMPNGVSYTNLFGGDLAILGGWNAGCTTRVEDPYATVIDGSGGDSGWFLRGGSIDIGVARMRFANVRWLVLNDFQTGCEANGQRFRIDRMVFDGASDSYRLGFFGSCHELELENSLIVGGDTGVDVGSYEAEPAPALRFVHNTILGASTSGIDIDHSFSDSGLVELYNNIVYGSGAQDLLVDNGAILAIGNNWASTILQNGSAFLPGTSNNVTTNPQLQANGRPIEPGSPVINTGTFGIPGGLPPVDLEGGPRVVGSKPDRGAFETSVTDVSLIIVSHFGDSGPGSLRQAILSANASPGVQLIHFDIGVSCPATIFLQTPLPDITDDLIIAGTSQPGSSSNTLPHGNNATICVRVRRNPNNSVSRALRVPPGSDALLWLIGISFGGFSTSALDLAGGANHAVQGNRFGGGSSDLPGNGQGIRVLGAATGVLIGGNSPSHRNIIAGNSGAGITILSTVSNVEINNNYIGTDPDGSMATPNQSGISFFGNDGLIRNNVISGNQGRGLALSGDGAFDVLVSGNRIGLKRPGAGGGAVLGNGGSGVFVFDGHDNSIGASGRGAGNTIAYNGDGGVVIDSGRRNRITRNAIFSNTGLGIDLAEPGVNPNDDDSAILPANYANRGLNFPVLMSASGDGFDSLVTGSLTTTPGVYRVELFAGSGRCDISGHGEGATYLGSVVVSIPVQNPGPPQGTAAISATLASTLNLTGKVITATATDVDGNTSEFSACRSYVSSDLIFADDFEGN